MPKQAFFNLSEEKRNLVFQAALQEFSNLSYDNASTNNICRQADISKGSLYQYFDDKLDLYSYVLSTTIDAKITFFSEILKDFHSLSLYEQIRLLFSQGFVFAMMYPDYSKLGDQFLVEKNEKAIAVINVKGETKANELFIPMIDQAKINGEINQTIDSNLLSLLFHAMNRTINEKMKEFVQNSEIESSIDFSSIESLVNAMLDMIFNGIAKN